MLLHCIGHWESRKQEWEWKGRRDWIACGVPWLIGSWYDESRNFWIRRCLGLLGSICERLLSARGVFVRNCFLLGLDLKDRHGWHRLSSFRGASQHSQNGDVCSSTCIPRPRSEGRREKEGNNNATNLAENTTDEDYSCAFTRTENARLQGIYKSQRGVQSMVSSQLVTGCLFFTMFVVKIEQNSWKNYQLI